MNPLLILQKLVQEYGFNIVIGQQYNRFIYSEDRIKIENASSEGDFYDYMDGIISQIKENNRGVRQLGFGLYRPYFENNIFYADIALMYCINIDRYVGYLNENDPGSVTLPYSRD